MLNNFSFTVVLAILWSIFSWKNDTFAFEIQDSNLTTYQVAAVTQIPELLVCKQLGALLSGIKLEILVTCTMMTECLSGLNVMAVRLILAITRLWRG